MSNSSADPTTCTIGKCKCGGIVFAAVDEPKRRKDTAKEVAKLVTRGFAIATLPIEEVRMGKWCMESKEHMRG